VSKSSRVTSRVIHLDVGNCEGASAVDAHELNWGVLEVEAGDG